MIIGGEWRERAETQAVCRILTEAGYQALFVGGCVRNALLAEPVVDVDIATDARPERVAELAGAAGLKPVPTGLEHGTITVVSGGHGYEVTTFRRDVETFGRHAVVAYSDRIEDDAARRDFTMNALYATPDGRLLDPLGSGLDDLRARRLRFVGDAHDRIREDYLRILRFFRFHAWYGDPRAGPDPDGLAASAELKAGIDSLSRERIGAEMRRLLAAPDHAPSVAEMERTGVLERLLPGAGATALAALVRAEGGRQPRWQRRLAVLGMQGNEAEALRLSRADGRALEVISEGLDSKAGPGVLGYRHGAELAGDIILARAALGGAAPPARWEAEVAMGAAAQFPVRAGDLMPELSGPALGSRLQELEERWIASGFMLDKAALLAR